MLGMKLPEYIFLAASSLFVIVDPLATVPAFLAMTPTATEHERMARRARNLLSLRPTSCTPTRPPSRGGHSLAAASPA